MDTVWKDYSNCTGETAMNIQVRWGATRFVILIGPIAIKIARVKPLRSIYKLLLHWQNGEIKKRLLDYADMPINGGFQYVLCGFISNLNEYALSRTGQHTVLVPTLFTFFGIFNIQKRGEDVDPLELLFQNPFEKDLKDMPELLLVDMTRAENFCLYEGQICLADYGSKFARSYFDQKLRRQTLSTVLS